MSSSLVKFAKEELDIIGLRKDSSDEADVWMRKNILKIVKEFAKAGFSGASAAYACSLLPRLLQFEPLSALTGHESEWVEITPTLFQNKRCYRVFKDKYLFDGQAYDSEAIIFQDKDGNFWTNSESRQPINFPYTPMSVYTQRDDDSDDYDIDYLEDEKTE